MYFSCWGKEIMCDQRVNSGKIQMNTKFLVVFPLTGMN